MLLRLYHLRCEVINMLGKLSLDQIEEVRKLFEKEYPEEYPMYNDLFAIGKDRKLKELRMCEILALAEQVKNTPSDAATSNGAM